MIPGWHRGHGLILLQYPDPQRFVAMPVWGVTVQLEESIVVYDSQRKLLPPRQEFQADGHWDNYTLYDYMPDFSNMNFPAEPPPEQETLSPPRLGLPAPE